MIEQILNWCTIFFGGLVLGFFTLSQWPPYSGYFPLDLDGWVLMVVAAVVGALPALIFARASVGLAGGIVLVLVACGVPVAASVVTSYLLGTTDLLDVILYSSIQRAIGQAVALFVFVIVGFAMGMTIEARIHGG